MDYKGRVENIGFKPIPSAKVVKVYDLGHIIEIVSQEKQSVSLMRLRKLSKYQYVDVLTGEVFDYSLSDNRSQNINSMRKTIHRIRRLINANFAGSDNELFITLTYAENMTDRATLYSDFKRFIRSLRSRYSREYDFEYINVIEPQGRGAWHCHLLLKCEVDKELYIPNAVISELWGCGFTKTKRLKGIDNIGAYLSAYLTDMEINAENVLDMLGDLSSGLQVVDRIVDEDGNSVSKKFVKGARLKLYPSGINIVRYSRGIVKPAVSNQPYAQIKEKTGSAKPDFSRSIAIFCDGSEEPVNTITYENYNLTRK